MKKGQFIIGRVILKSELSIEELGVIISEKILGGSKLSGLEKNIYEEVPAIFNGLLGFSVVLQGYSGFDTSSGYCFELVPNFSTDETAKELIDLSPYLISLFKEKLKFISQIKIIDI